VTITHRLAAILVSCIAALVFPAQAHQGGTTGLASIAIGDTSIRYSLTLPDVPMPSPLAEQMGFGQPGVTLDYLPLARAVAEKMRFTNNGAACVAAPGQIVPPSATAVTVTAIVDFVCPGKIRELGIHDDLFDVAGPNLHTLARIEWPGGVRQFVFASEARETTVSVGAKSEAARRAGNSFALGVAHVLSGYDLLLFLLVLMLRGGGWVRLLQIIAAFTAAHSVTLALAAFDLVTIPDRLVGALVAASIAYVAAENLFPKYAVSRRWAVSLVCGLVHGFAFAQALREIGMPRENLAASLLNFNLGIEAGQAMVVLLIVPILMLMRGKPWERKLVATISAIVLAVGLFLFVERAPFGV
jgi:hypothetical protein